MFLRPVDADQTGSGPFYKLPVLPYGVSLSVCMCVYIHVIYTCILKQMFM